MLSAVSQPGLYERTRTFNARPVHLAPSWELLDQPAADGSSELLAPPPGDSEPLWSYNRPPIPQVPPTLWPDWALTPQELRLDVLELSQQFCPQGVQMVMVTKVIAL